MGGRFGSFFGYFIHILLVVPSYFIKLIGTIFSAIFGDVLGWVGLHLVHAVRRGSLPGGHRHPPHSVGSLIPHCIEKKMFFVLFKDIAFINRLFPNSSTHPHIK